MKYIKKDGVILEGTPEEIAIYHEKMAHKMKGKSRRSRPQVEDSRMPTQSQKDLFNGALQSDWRKIPKIRKRYVTQGTTFSRATWTSPENSFLIEHKDRGWKVPRITNALNRQGISKIKRTSSAVSKQLGRLL